MSEPFTLLLAFSIAIALVGFLGAWVLKSMTVRMRDLDRDIRETHESLNDDLRGMRSDFGELRDQLSERYVRRTDFEHGLDNLFDALRRIEHKVDRKQDAPVRYRPATDFTPLEQRSNERS
jgi:hypothetical protein